MADLRIAVADDHYLVREGVRQLLELEGDLTVSVSVGTAVELLHQVAREPVDVVVCDIRMPPEHRTEGIELAHELHRRHPGTGVVVLSAHADDAYARDLFRDGTAGRAYLLKDRVGDRAELVGAVRAVARGDSVVDPWVVDALVRRAPAGRLGVLTARELEVLAAMATGRSNPAIGAALHLSVSAVEKHITSIFGKLSLHEETAVHRRVAAVLAYLNG